MKTLNKIGIFFGLLMFFFGGIFIISFFILIKNLPSWELSKYYTTDPLTEIPTLELTKGEQHISIVITKEQATKIKESIK